MKCFPCKVFTFGSVPPKTYLPDSDIDLTAFSDSPNLKDSWASEVCDLLQTKEKNENAEFQVKIIKCLVENIVVDISFNELGGLCTLCFLEEVDHLISLVENIVVDISFNQLGGLCTLCFLEEVSVMQVCLRIL
ncbi:putative polymerase, nucleotidyl transferase domain, Nucleotidyltransferase superfamily [Helianthus annuus]|nr:putative polymerase, nucleotidyl transferase domain, Nucleotidyltransferase superfamily [Helianthus annuus]